MGTFPDPTLNGLLPYGTQQDLVSLFHIKFPVVGALNLPLNNDTEILGMTWDGNNFWLLTYDWSNDTNTLCKISPLDGSIVENFDLTYPKWSLAWDGDYLWCMGYENEEYRLYKVNSFNGDIVAVYPTQPIWGLDYHDGYLWGLDLDQESGLTRIDKINPIDGTLISQVELPKGDNNHYDDLTWDGEYFWLVGDVEYWRDRRLFKVSPYDGSIVLAFDKPCEFSNWWWRNIVWVNGYIWGNSYEWDEGHKLLKIDILQNE